MAQNQDKKFKNYYICLGNSYDPIHDPDEIAIESSKMQRKGWEILVNYFAQKSQIFRCYFSDQEFFLRELKLIKPFLGEFKPADEFGASDETSNFFKPELIVDAFKKALGSDSFLEPAEDTGSGKWLKAECQITPEFLEALIKSPPHEGVSPLFDFKFYQDGQQRFNSSDHGSDVTFNATTDEAKEAEALLKQAGVIFDYLSIS